MIFAGICAGGQGVRLNSETGSDIPKQFLDLGGRPMISYSVEAFLACKEIDRIFVAAAGEYTDYCKRLFPDPRVKVIEGGATRADTVALLVKECGSFGENASPEDILITHDAARPFVSTDIIRRSVEAAREYGASGVAVGAFDTVLQCRGGFVCGAPPRSEMYLAQTPQCFKTGLFNKVWNGLTEREKAEATDVCGMFFRAGVNVKIVEGARECFKITVKEDMDRAEAYLNGYGGLKKG